MRILVIGAGAVGGWLAATLARGGADVSLLARGQTLAAIRADGLVVQEREGRQHLAVRASDSVGDLPRPDVIILAVKAYGFAEAVAGASSAFAHGPVVVTAMNGLPWWFLADLAGPLQGQRLESIDPAGTAAARLANVRPLGAVVHVSAMVERPGIIRVAAVDRLILGEPGGATSPETVELARTVAAGNVPCPVTSDIRAEIWSKLWGNMVMNPVSALTRRGANGMLGDPPLFALVRAMMGEFAALGARIGLPLPMTVDERLVVMRRLGDFRTSMLADLEAGRPLEVDAMLGVVVEMADRLGEALPASRAVYALARTLPGAA